ncbi:MAG: helix-turn-helix domain-containing protein [Solirubrobacterales bacterium]
MGRRSEEQLRVEAVRRRLAGESPERIAASMGRTRRWVAKWVARQAGGEADWASGRKPGRASNRTDEDSTAQVIAIRTRLADNPWAQIGSDAIAWELEKLGIDRPSTRTIERILRREGLVRPRRGNRPKSKGLPYPAPPAEAVGDLHQADLVGPRHLDGGLPFVAFNCVDIAPHAAAIEIAPDQQEDSITTALLAAWDRLGVPRRLQLDNGKPFVLGAASLGEIVRVSLHQGATPVFIPQGEPWRNGVCEQFNDTFDKRFFRSERFADRTQIAARALAFESFHNANHRYRSTGKRTPDELTADAQLRRPTPLGDLPEGWPSQGRIEFIRFIRSDRKLRLLRRSIPVAETLVYRYVTAVLDLSIPAGEDNLLVSDTEGELVATASVPRPGE